MDVALGVNASQTVHQLEGDDDYRLNLEFAFFERLLEFLQVDAQKLHDQIVVVLVRAVRVEPWEPDSSVPVSRYRLAVVLLHLLLLNFGVELHSLRILVLDAVLLQRFPLGELHHVFHEGDLPLEFGLVLARLLHL